MSGDERANRAANILDAWAEAIRGDWGSIDGRSCRAQLWEIGAYLRGARDTLTYRDVNVCVEGGAHWFGDGWDHKCGEIDGEQ